MTIKVLVVDDQTVVRESLALVLDLQESIEVIGSAENGQMAIELADQQEPDVVLMDLNMPVLGGAEATEQILAAHPRTAVVVLTTFADEESILRALSAGARGYLTKEASRADIVRAVQAAAAGQSVLDPAVQARLVAAASSPMPAAPAPPGIDLTPREREVLTLIGEGLTNKAIAERLFVSEATVKTHINNLFAKAQVGDRVEAARLAFSLGLVDPAAPPS